MARAQKTLPPLRGRVPAEQAGEGSDGPAWLRLTANSPEPSLPSPDPLRGPPSPAEGRGIFAAVVGFLLLATPALADDKAECAAGIADIKAKVATLAPDAIPPKLKKALRVAEREQGEGEFDECLEALDDAKRALPR